MFNRYPNLSYTYEKQGIEKIEQRIVAGQKLTFDLFLKPVPDSSKCLDSKDSTSECPTESVREFLTC